MRSLAYALAAAVFLLPGTGLAASGSTIGTIHIPTVKPPPPLDPRAPVSDWKGAQAVALPWDVTHQRPASEPSSALISTDDQFLYVRFDVKQREGLLAQQHTNNVGDGTDDEVWIDLWPSGPNGFFYQFAATSNGTHFQYSSENTAYAPTWESFGAVFSGGFTVTMKIPLRVIRGSSGTSSWRAQFVRVIRSTGERQIWSYDKPQTNGDDVNYAGALTGLKAAAVARPQPRLGTYALGALGPPNSGLTTSRIGLDVSIPITATASFYSTLHPDYSNLEIDQQTITPTAFTRSFQETRPFFTQAAGFYNNFNCDACPGIQELYTPNIPTPASGYAFEGVQGQVGAAAFDAIGDGRTDAAQAFSYHTPDNHWSLTGQRVAADCNLPLTALCPGDLTSVHDDVVTTGLNYNDSKHLNAYFNYGSDSGSNVAVGDQAQRYDGGAFYYTNTFGAAFSARKVGYYYNPVDGLVQHPDIAGYAGFLAKIWLFSPNDVFNSVGVAGFLDRYHNAAGDLDQTDNNITFDFLTRSRIDVLASFGSSYLLANNCVTAQGNLITVDPINYGLYRSCQIFTPISQDGIGLTWHSGTVNSPGNFPNHGPSSTPVTVTYNSGRFGPGRVDAWTRIATMRIGMRGIFSAEVDDTRQYLDDGGTNIQWLERAGYTHTFGPDTAISFGVRREIGVAPFVVSNAPAQCITYLESPLPNTPCTGAWNLSFAYHKRTPKDEYYFAYGDAAQLSTVPQWVLKWIHYIGAEKGT
jgi:Domain of unknown function (DUF5916)